MSDNTSTSGSYLDSAKATVNSIIGSVTGNPADQREADRQQDKADAKDAASHATAKVGPFTATPSGVATDDSRRTEGSWDQTIGSGKETLGNLIGSEDMKRDGREQNTAGQGKEAEGQLSDLGKGVGDRVSGAVGGAVAGLTGNAQTQREYESIHDRGKAQQRGAEHDIQKQNQ